MANLPDLDTGSIGMIAYWNAIDQGGASGISPDEVLSDGSIPSYTIYDNGVEGQYNLTTGRQATFRVKNDGWMVVYLDRTEKYAVNRSNVADCRGPWDVANAWTSGTSEIEQSTLERAINSLQANLSNSGSITYNTTDVGLYDYAHPNVSTVTVLSAENTGATEASDVTDYGFSYTSGTNRVVHAVVGKAIRNQYAEGQLLSPSLSDIANCTTGGGTVYGSYDLLGNAEAPDAATEYSIRHQYNDLSEYANNGDPFYHTNFIMWY